MRQDLYRISTEKRNYSKVIALLSREFSGFRVFEGLGSWKGVQEPTLLIEIMGDVGDIALQTGVFKVAREIRKLNRQEAVGVEFGQIEMVEIREPKAVSPAQRGADAILKRSKREWLNRLG